MKMQNKPTFGTATVNLSVIGISIFAYGIAVVNDPTDPQADQPHSAVAVFSSTAIDTGVEYVKIPNTIEGSDFYVDAPAPNVASAVFSDSDVVVFRGRFDRDT